MKTIAQILENHAVWNLWREMPPDSPDKYQAYLCSHEWAEKRKAVLERCGGICERCKINQADSVHHLTYQHKYAESLDELRAFCRGCHEYTHGLSDVDPRLVAIQEYRQLPLAISLSDDQSAESSQDSVLCPVCGDTYSHIDRVEQDTRSANQGDLTIHFWAECGHAWSLVFEGSNGKTTCFTTNFKDKDNA